MNCVDYLAAFLVGVKGLRPRLPVISEAADQVAGRLVADGRLLLASVRPDFTSEGFVRSGGLMLAEEWTPETALSPNDAVILGWSGAPPDQELELLRGLRASGALIVGIGPASWAAGLVGWGGCADGGRPILGKRNFAVRGSDRSLRRRGLSAGFPAELGCLMGLYRRDRGRLDPDGTDAGHVSECAGGRGEGSQCPVLSARGSTRRIEYRRFL